MTSTRFRQHEQADRQPHVQFRRWITGSIRWNESNPNTYAVGPVPVQQHFHAFQSPGLQDGRLVGKRHGFVACSVCPTTGSGSRFGFDSPLSLQTHYAGLFIQDDFKITPRLTLNLGLR